MNSFPEKAFQASSQEAITPLEKEPVLGGQLRAKAVWVDEVACIGCRYCAHVATNTFLVEDTLGRSRAIRQDGDSTDLIQEAIDTCPVDCIHWVEFEELEKLKKELEMQDITPLGILPKVSRLKNRSEK